MAKRYGRNQRRRAREEIARLAAMASAADSRAQYAVRRIADAKADAFNAFMRQHGHMERCMSIMAQEFARMIEPQLRPHALKLLAAAIHSQDEPLRFTLDQSVTDRTVEVLRGELKPLNYNIALL